MNEIIFFPVLRDFTSFNIMLYFFIVASFNYVACLPPVDKPAGRQVLAGGKTPGGQKIQNFPVLDYRSLQKDSGLYCRRSKAINL